MKSKELHIGMKVGFVLHSKNFLMCGNRGGRKDLQAAESMSYGRLRE